MKTKAAILLLASSPVICAGTPQVIPNTAPSEQWIIPLIDIRARYEFGDVDAFDPSHAFTVRERLGLKTMAWNGFSATIEGEFSQAIIEDYHGGAFGADPFDPANTLIADPETNELNQAFLQYEGYDTIAKLGRQKIIYDNAAFIGNVGWRQNEQTYDALSFTNKSIDSLTFNYAYLNQVNRIFGSDADGPVLPVPNVEDIGSSIHLFNASYAGIQSITLGGYAYVMNFEDLGSWDNNTFGMSAKGNLLGLALYGELSYQDKAGMLAEDDALYAHITATKTLGTQTMTLGMEHLDDGFKTPLATVHAFNGFADVTDPGRISGAQNGLTDVYVSHTMPIFWGLKWTNVLHALGDNTISTGYGWEYDSVLAKKFNDNFTAIAKFAQFESEGDAYTAAGALPTASRFSIELNYTF